LIESICEKVKNYYNHINNFLGVCMTDKVEERKEKIKPIKLFSINATVFDDGYLSGYGAEYRNMGRLKNQKMIVPDKDEFKSCIRSLIPSALPVVDTIIDVIYKDNESEDAEGNEKVGKLEIEIYSDGFVSTDFAEITKQTRGAPKVWRMHGSDFIRFVDSRFGNLADKMRPLLNAGSTTTLDTTATVSEVVDEVEEEIEESGIV
jgi:hypothetical protein